MANLGGEEADGEGVVFGEMGAVSPCPGGKGAGFGFLDL